MKRIGFITGVIAVGLVIDQATKVMAQDALQGMPPQSYLGGFLTLIYAENSGVALSLGQGLSPSLRFALFTVGAGLLLVGLLGYLLAQRDMLWGETLAYTLVVCGGLGNLIDRVFQDGHVIDFLLLRAGPLSTAIFNVADMLIVGGVSTLLVMMWIHRPTQKPEPEPEL